MYALLQEEAPEQIMMDADADVGYAEVVEEASEVVEELEAEPASEGVEPEMASKEGLKKKKNFLYHGRETKIAGCWVGCW